MKYRIGLNGNGQNWGSEQEWIDWHIAARPTATLVMNNLHSAAKLAAAVPGMIVIHRVKDDNENKAAQLSPTAFVSALPNIPGIWNSVINEGEWRGIDLQNLANWLADVVIEAAKQGKRVVVGNWSTGFIQKNELQTGIFDKLIRALAAHPQHGILGLHEYAMAVIPNAVTGRDPRHLITGENLKKEQWMSAAEFQAMDHDSHIGRCIQWNNRAKTLNVAVPRIVLTEVGMDRTKDYSRQVPEVLRYLDDLTDNYNEAEKQKWADGVFTYGAYFQKHFAGQDIQDIYNDQLEWLNEVQLSNVEGMCLFAYNHASEWKNYNVARMPDLLKNLKEYAIKLRNEVVVTPPVEPPAPPVVEPPVVTPPPTPELVPFPTDGFTWRLVYANKDAANIRHQPLPVPQGIAMGLLSYTPQAAQVARSKAHNGWIPVILKNGLRGWIMDTVFDDIDFIVSPDLKEELEALRATLADAMTTIDHLLGDTTVEKLSA
jgi:hypothetical protein